MFGAMVTRHSVFAFVSLALAGCVQMDMQTAHEKLRDNSELSITRFRDENPGGMDSTTIVVERWSPECGCSKILDISHSFQEGGMRTLFHGAGTVAIGATGFAVGEALRRPDRSSISVSSGNASATGGNSEAESGSSSSAESSSKSLSLSSSKSSSASWNKNTSSNSNTNNNYNGNSINTGSSSGGGSSHHHKK